MSERAIKVLSGFHEAALTDCVEVCPLDCFLEGPEMLIRLDECIDCGVCEPECPAEALRPESSGLAWLLSLVVQFTGIPI